MQFTSRTLLTAWLAMHSLPGLTAALDYASFLAGSGDDQPAAIAHDSFDHVFVGGATTSRDMPAMRSGAFPATLHGDQHLCFVSGLSKAGKHVDFTELLPAPRPTLEPLVGAENLVKTASLANGECRITAMDTDLWGTLYVAGSTTWVHSGDANHPASVPNGSSLGFVQKFKVRGDGDAGGPGLTLQWSKLLGDVPRDAATNRLATSVTLINALVTTPAGDVVIAGSSTSRFYPTVAASVSGAASYQPALSGRQSGVVSVLDYTGTVVASTYLGTSDPADHDTAVSFAGVAVDSHGDIVVGGTLDHRRWLWSQWLTGFLSPNKYPVTANAFLPIELSEFLTLNGTAGVTDAVLTKFDAGLSTLRYSVIDSAAFCPDDDGRIAHTSGERVGVDGDDNMYLLMLTNTRCMYTTPLAAQSQRSGERDAVLLQVPSDGHGGSSSAPIFSYQSYLGFGADSIVNHCALSIASASLTPGSHTAFIGCNVVNARRKAMPILDALIAAESPSATDGQPAFPGENWFIARLDLNDSVMTTPHIVGIGGTYANRLADMRPANGGSALHITGSTLSTDFPVTSDAADRIGSTQQDGVVATVDVAP